MKSIVALLMLVVFSSTASHVTPQIKSATKLKSSHIEASKKPIVHKVTPPKKEAVKTPEKAPEQVAVQAAPTPPVVASPPVQPAPPSQPATATGGCEIANNFNWPKNIAVAVCWGESTNDQFAIGDRNTPYPSCGLMQIRTLPGRPSCAQLHDPYFNMQYAYNMWTREGWRPWSAYTTGKYLRYLK